MANNVHERTTYGPITEIMWFDESFDDIRYADYHGIQIDHMVHHIATNLRTADRQECEWGTGMDAGFVIEHSLKESSIFAVAFEENDRQLNPIAVYGVAPMPYENWMGVPWMLATPDIANHPTAVLKISKQFMKILDQHYAYLCNYVCSNNLLSVRYLKHLGFELDSPEPWGVKQVLFHKFHRSASHV